MHGKSENLRQTVATGLIFSLGCGRHDLLNPLNSGFKHGDSTVNRLLVKTDKYAKRLVMGLTYY